MTMIDAARRVLLAGASGLIGSRLLPRLLAAAEVALIVSLVRRRTSSPLPAELREVVVDFSNLPPAAEVAPVDDVYLTLGTTLKKAGSQEAFRAVDFAAVLAVARLGREAGARRLMLVSSVDADARARNFYLRVKGEVEDAVAALGYPELHVLRPSLLLGPREERRPGERFAQVATRLVDPFLRGPLGRYHSIEGDAVAAALLGASRSGRAGRHVYHHRELLALGQSV